MTLLFVWSRDIEESSFGSAESEIVVKRELGLNYFGMVGVPPVGLGTPGVILVGHRGATPGYRQENGCRRNAPQGKVF